MMLLLMRAIISSTTVSSWPGDGLVWAISQGAPTNVASKRTANLFIKYLTRRACTRAASPGIKFVFVAAILPRLGPSCWREAAAKNRAAALADAGRANLAGNLGVRDAVRQTAYGAMPSSIHCLNLAICSLGQGRSEERRVGKE